MKKRDGGKEKKEEERSGACKKKGGWFWKEFSSSLAGVFFERFLSKRAACVQLFIGRHSRMLDNLDVLIVVCPSFVRLDPLDDVRSSPGMMDAMRIEKYDLFEIRSLTYSEHGELSENTFLKYMVVNGESSIETNTCSQLKKLYFVMFLDISIIASVWDDGPLPCRMLITLSTPPKGRDQEHLWKINGQQQHMQPRLALGRSGANLKSPRYHSGCYGNKRPRIVIGGRFGALEPRTRKTLKRRAKAILDTPTSISFISKPISLRWKILIVEELCDVA
ncbi:hypothetical protein VNO77_08098 [Canavalia gladiata]|uniref:Uncharacterized protein n=1 Tax=Canavalia gladiata TaxID=3824 RepID=A0AAN9MDP3_CANGL